MGGGIGKGVPSNALFVKPLEIRAYVNRKTYISKEKSLRSNQNVKTHKYKMWSYVYQTPNPDKGYFDSNTDYLFIIQNILEDSLAIAQLLSPEEIKRLKMEGFIYIADVARNDMGAFFRKWLLFLQGKRRNPYKRNRYRFTSISNGRIRI